MSIQCTGQLRLKYDHLNWCFFSISFTILTSIGFLLSIAPCCRASGSAITLSNSFKAVSGADGRRTCGGGQPWKTFSSDQLLSSTTTKTTTMLSMEALCAWKCTVVGNCSSFNWKRFNSSCELFYSQPNTCIYTCIYLCGCALYQVS